MKIKTKFIKKKLLLRIELVIIIILVSPALLSVFFINYYGRIYPGIFINNHQVSHLKHYEAEEKLAKNSALPSEILLTARTQNEQLNFKIPLEDIEVSYHFGESIEKAYGVGRSGNIIHDLGSILSALKNPVHIPLITSYNEEQLDNHLSVIAGQIASDPVQPSIKVVDKNVVVDPGKVGDEVNTKEIKEELLNKLRREDYNPIVIKVHSVDYTLTEEEVERAKERATKLLTKSILAKHEYSEFSYKGSTLISWLNPSMGYNREALLEVIETIEKSVNREPQNPTLVFEEGRVKEFVAAKDGLQVKLAELETEIVNALRELEDSEIKEVEVQIPVTATPPTIKTGDVNNLGIKELIGRGSSKFRGSISSRIHNIALAASRINGTLVKPGEEFSFNRAVGDVSKLTGYKEAYVIQDGKTVLGDGGGVCQVSTTLFRAVLAAGLPITERRGHSYRVGYYEQDSPPGLDATVYSPTTDFIFLNDTPGHILVQATPDTKNVSLVFELYGSSDGRIATTTKPVITSSTAPPEDSYVDDPTLPAGTTKQIEYKAWGAKVQFNYEVKRSDEVIYKKTFYTNYRPWGAVFLKGIGQ